MFPPLCWKRSLWFWVSAAAAANAKEVRACSHACPLRCASVMMWTLMWTWREVTSPVRLRYKLCLIRVKSCRAANQKALLIFSRDGAEISFTAHQPARETGTTIRFYSFWSLANKRERERTARRAARTHSLTRGPRQISLISSLLQVLAGWKIN